MDGRKRKEEKGRNMKDLKGRKERRKMELGWERRLRRGKVDRRNR